MVTDALVAHAVYILCAVTSGGCALLLWRRYRATKHRLLAWSSVCFAGLTLNNVLLVLDLIVVTHIDLSRWRTGTALIAFAALIFGLIWEDEA